MELPRSAGDAVPDTTPGALLALADRLDRATRLGLLASICELAATVIDWQALGTAIGR